MSGTLARATYNIPRGRKQEETQCLDMGATEGFEAITKCEQASGWGNRDTHRYIHQKPQDYVKLSISAPHTLVVTYI